MVRGELAYCRRNLAFADAVVRYAVVRVVYAEGSAVEVRSYVYAHGCRSSRESETGGIVSDCVGRSGLAVSGIVHASCNGRFPGTGEVSVPSARFDFEPVQFERNGILSVFAVYRYAAARTSERNARRSRFFEYCRSGCGIVVSVFARSDSFRRAHRKYRARRSERSSYGRFNEELVIGVFGQSAYRYRMRGSRSRFGLRISKRRRGSVFHLAYGRDIGIEGYRYAARRCARVRIGSFRYAQPGSGFGRRSSKHVDRYGSTRISTGKRYAFRPDSVRRGHRGSAYRERCESSRVVHGAREGDSRS